MNNYSVGFNYNKVNCDWKELAGNFCLESWHTSHGTIVTAKGSTLNPGKVALIESKGKRILSTAELVFQPIAILVGICFYALSQTRQAHVRTYEFYKNKLVELAATDLSKEGNLLSLHSVYPFFAPLDNAEKAEEKGIKEQEDELKQVLNDQQQLLDTELLVQAKTAYWRALDKHKAASKGPSYPEPDPILPLSETASLELALPQAGKCLKKVPEYVKNYWHAVDTKEDEGPLEYLGITNETENNWSNLWDYINKEILANPLRELTSNQLYALIRTLSEKIHGKDPGIRDFFMIVHKSGVPRFDVLQR